MPKEQLIKLAEALASAGYEIEKLKHLHGLEHRYGEIKLTIYPAPNKDSEENNDIN
jgi:hypothetical protein